MLDSARPMLRAWLEMRAAMSPCLRLQEKHLRLQDEHRQSQPPVAGMLELANWIALRPG